MPTNNTEIEKRLWDAADQLRANSRLKSSEYSAPVLGLIYLRFADHRFSVIQQALEVTLQQQGGRRTISKADYQARGVLYIPEQARFSYLLNLPESENIGQAINDAMRAIEAENEELRGVLPKDYNRLENDTLVTLLKTFSEIPVDFEGDIFGRIYEYFLGKFAMAEGQRGGEFFTPTSLVKLIVEIIEPYHGRILDPACGSGGMFVQSANFIKRHQKSPNTEISIYGQDKVAETVRLCRMNLAVHGLSGDIKQGNSYYEDTHNSLGHFDFLMANPPFNVNGVDKEKIKNDPRYVYGVPVVDNANFLWIQIFTSALNETGRAGVVMSNSASNAGQSELAIRKKMIEDQIIDVIIAIGSNFFYTVTLACTLWFIDKGKKYTNRKEKVLFIDASHIFHQVDRAHREFTADQVEFLANIVRLFKGEPVETSKGCEELMDKYFPSGNYIDIPGICNIATLDEIRRHNYSLIPGQYVGVTGKENDDFDFQGRFKELAEELERLNVEARELESQIAENMAKLLEGIS